MLISIIIKEFLTAFIFSKKYKTPLQRFLK